MAFHLVNPTVISSDSIRPPGRSTLPLQFACVPLLLILVLLPSSSAVEIENGLVGEPEVECGSNSVEMQFRTERPFRGKVFVKGHYNNPNCRVDYSNAYDSNKPTGGIVLQHGHCDMDRQRMLQPQGMQFSAIVIVSFHPLFITKVDRAFHIKCMYREMSQRVTQHMEVSNLATTQIDQTFPMPVCTYTIRKDEIDGEVLRYARVGDQVVHRWECQTDVYGILVHSCVVEDGQGERKLLVDERGCHVDSYLLGDPTYVEALDMAYRESHVFKFADRVAVRFQCQIKLCMRENGGCTGITPPLCTSSPRSERLIQKPSQSVQKPEPSTDYKPQISNDNKTMSTTTTPLTTTTTMKSNNVSDSDQDSMSRRKRDLVNVMEFEPVDGDFQSQFIYVLDSTEDPAHDSPDNTEQYRRVLLRSRGAIVSELQGAVCLSTTTFGVLLGAIFVVLLSLISIGGILVWARCRRQRASSKIRQVDGSSSASGSDWNSATSQCSIPTVWS